MKKSLILLILVFSVTGALFADFSFKFYPGLYLGGGNVDKTYKLSIGADLQLGFEIGGEYDGYIIGIFGNCGIDSGLPNSPNLYYGFMIDLLGGDEIFMGISAGLGRNIGLASGLNSYDTAYIRVGIPFSFYGIIKSSLYLDWYFDIGLRLGYIIHLGIGS